MRSQKAQVQPLGRSGLGRPSCCSQSSLHCRSVTTEPRNASHFGQKRLFSSIGDSHEKQLLVVRGRGSDRWSVSEFSCGSAEIGGKPKALMAECSAADPRNASKMRLMPVHSNWRMVLEFPVADALSGPVENFGARYRRRCRLHPFPILSIP